MKYARSAYRKLCLFSALVGYLIFTTNVSLAADTPPKFGGKCFSCHEDVVKNFGKTGHAKSWSGSGRQANCESCHGSADQHIAAGGSKETIIMFGKESKRSADEQNKQCLECHKKTPALAMWDQGFHKRNDVACASCHGVHKENLAKEPETCFACHKDVKRDISKLSHHPIVEGKVGCYDCHNPHGSLSHGMLKADNVNQLCYKCHVDKRGPFMWEHAPVEENCTTCHTPHGSNHQQLLVAPSPYLCKNCHSGPHGGQSYASRMGAGSPSSKFFARGCLNCHNRIHGSNGPGGKWFTR